MITRNQQPAKLSARVLSLLLLFVLGACPSIRANSFRQAEQGKTSLPETADSMDNESGALSTDGPDQFSAENSARRLEFSPGGLRYLPRPNSYDSNFVFNYRLREVSGSGIAYAPENENSFPRPVQKRDQVYYFHSPGLVEKYRALDTGVEQSLVLSSVPTSENGTEDLIITSEIATNLTSPTPETRSIGSLAFYSGGRPVLGVGPATVVDAAGKKSIVELRFEQNQLRMIIAASWLRNKTFPLTVRSSVSTFSGPAGWEMSAESERQASVAEASPVWRVSLRLQTNSGNDSGTTNLISVQLQEPGNLTRLYYGRDNNFQPNDNYIYDLQLDSVHRLSDITMLRISKDGEDNWCLRSLTLYVNDNAIYDLDFGPFGHWFENDPGAGGYTISSPALRSNGLWLSYVQPPLPMNFPVFELESRVESILGSWLPGTAYYWGFISNYAVEVTKQDSHDIHVDLDLGYRQTFPYADPEVDVDFDVGFSCNNGKIHLTMQNLSVRYICHSPFCSEFPTADNHNGLVTFLRSWIVSRIEQSLNNFTYVDSAGQPACPTITVLSDGSVSLQFPVDVCAATITPASQDFSAAGGTGHVNVSTGPLCRWNAVSNATFISLDGTIPPRGSGGMGYTVAPNTGPARTGTIDIAGETFTVRQAAGASDLTITTSSPLPVGAVGQFYSQMVSATGGAQPFWWHLVSGTLPAGLGINSFGNISGTPTAAGTSTFTIGVSDTASHGAQKQFSITIAAAAPALAAQFQGQSAPSSVEPGQSFNVIMSWKNTGTATWSDAAGIKVGSQNPPNNTTWGGSRIVFSASTSIQSGQDLSFTVTARGPTTPGTYNFQWQMFKEGTGFFGDASTNLVITVATSAVFTVSAASNLDAVKGVAFSYQLSATGGTQPYIWSLSAGALPPGLGLAANTGVVSGSPTAVGSWSFTIGVTDAARRTAQKTIAIIVGYPPLVITTTDLPSLTVGASYNQLLNALGGDGIYTWRVAGGELPPGLALGQTGLISGTASTSGSFNSLLTVRDSAGASAGRSFVIQVVASGPAPHITSVKYKPGGGKLIVGGEFAEGATLWVDAQQVQPRSSDTTSFVVKKLFLASGQHTVRVFNPGGAGSETVVIVVE